jgi:hypothetical protein
MIDVKIGGSEHSWNSVGALDDGWVNSRVHELQVADGDVCVLVRIEQDQINLVLATPSCPPGAVYNRRLTPDEQHVVDLWVDKGLGKRGFGPEHVIAFFRHLRNMLD